jgi:hypothetical protein
MRLSCFTRSGWITEFSPSRVLLTKELDGSCPDHYLIKEKDGYVAVFQSIENGEGVLIAVPNTRMNVGFLENRITRNQCSGRYNG